VLKAIVLVQNKHWKGHY